MESESIDVTAARAAIEIAEMAQQQEEIIYGIF